MSKIFISTEENIILDWIREGYTEEEAERKFSELKSNFELGIDRSFYMDASGQVITTAEHVSAIEEHYGIKMIALELG